MFGCQGYPSNCKLTIVKQGMTDWPGNDAKITSDSSLKLGFSNSSQDLVIEVLVSILCDLRSLSARVTHLIENWLL